MKQRQNNSPDIPSQVHQRTWLALENITDYAAFQQLSDEVLSAHWGYKIHPRGMSARGTVKGHPDSWGHDDKGKLCAFEYGTSPDWRGKLEDDLEQVARLKGFSPEVFVFCTNRFVSADAEREYVAMVQRTYGWELHLFGQGDLAIPLDTTCQYIRKRFLDVDVERHNWSSLLGACKDQRRKTLRRYSGKYNPTLYVHRDAEQKIDAWYRQAKMSIRQEQSQGKEKKTLAQLFVLVDQAGSGKTNIVLHLAEEYGKDAPVIVIPGSHTITDDHTLEREIVEAMGYPVDDRTYHAKIYELCQIAQHEGYPFIVVVEGINENSDPTKIRKAIEQLLFACQDYPLLLLITCRDTIWPSIHSSAIEGFISEEGAVSLGLYTDEEFEQACRKYFPYWNVRVELSVEAKQSLRSPLLLSIFAEANQDRSFKFVPFVVAKDLWEKYLELKINAIHDTLERGKSKQAIRTAIEHTALRMLERNSSSLSSSDISDLNRHIDPDDTRPQSLFLQLKNSGVIYEDTPETISFVYETFFEFITAQTLARMFEKSLERESVLRRIEELAQAYRWRQIPLYIAELVSEPDLVVERLCSSNLWLAAQALKRVPSIVSARIRQRVILDLEEKLNSKFSFDRQRAADLLGMLGANESKDKLFHCWTTYTPNSYESQAVLRALARLGVEDVVEPFIRYLGRRLEWYRPVDQELVDMLPENFRQHLLEKALALLHDSENMYAAAHTLGYLKAEQAVTPLLAHLQETEWLDWVTLLTLVHIGTPEAFDVLEIALGEIGEQLTLNDQQFGDAELPLGDREKARQSRNELFQELDIVRTHGMQHCPLDMIVPFVIRLLEHSNFYVRFTAIQCAGQLGASETALALVKSRPPGAWRPGMGIIEALIAIGTQIEVDPILALVNDPSTSDMVLSDAIFALGVSRDKRALEPLSMFITQHRFMFQAVQALGYSHLPEAIPILVQVIKDTTIDFTTSNSLSRENLDNRVIAYLGKLQHPDAFEYIEQFICTHLPKVGEEAIYALAASGDEQAIPLLHELWNLDPESHQSILEALFWIGTKEATDTILELLYPLDVGKAALLVHVLHRGRALSYITDTTYFRPGVLASTDARLVTIIDTYFDEMTPEAMLFALFDMEYIATPQARQLLERVASSATYDIPRPTSSPDSPQTIRDVAIVILCHLGSATVIDAVLDTLAHQPASVVEYNLAKMEHNVVKEALQRRLKSANEVTLIPLLTLLGTFGDHTVLPALQPYTDDPRQEVADVAYVAAQRILGLAYF